MTGIEGFLLFGGMIVVALVVVIAVGRWITL